MVCWFCVLVDLVFALFEFVVIVGRGFVCLCVCALVVT